MEKEQLKISPKQPECGPQHLDKARFWPCHLVGSHSLYCVCINEVKRKVKNDQKGTIQTW